MHKCTVDEIISDQLTVNPGFWGQLPVFPALNWRENEWAQIMLHTCKAAVDKKHLLTLPSNSTGTLLAPPSRPHAFTRGSEQCVASDNSSPPHPATHLHHTSRRRQVCTQFNFISNHWFHLAGAGCFSSVLSNRQTSPPLIMLQLRSRKWRVTRSHPAGFAESRPHPAHILSPGPEKRVLPLPLWLGLWHVAQDGLA